MHTSKRVTASCTGLTTAMQVSMLWSTRVAAACTNLASKMTACPMMPACRGQHITALLFAVRPGQQQALHCCLKGCHTLLDMKHWQGGGTDFCCTSPCTSCSCWVMQAEAPSYVRCLAAKCDRLMIKTARRNGCASLQQVRQTLAVLPSASGSPW